MNVLEEAKKRPVASGLTLVGAAGAVLLFMNVLPGLELIVSIKKAPEIAQAALQKAEEANDWIAAYIEDQKKQREFDQRMAEREDEYQRQMLELQKQQQMQQQVPAYPQSYPNQAPSPRIWREQTDEGDWYCTDGQDAWWPDRVGSCD